MSEWTGTRSRLAGRGESAEIHIGGYGAIAAEIISGMGGRVPRYVAVPVGNGTIIAGIYRGFLQALGEGRSDEVPHMARELRECEGIEAIPAATVGLLAHLEHQRMSRVEDAERAPLETGDVVAVLTSGVLTQ